MLNWPTPQRVKAFPRQRATQKTQKRAPRKERGQTAGHMPDEFGEDQAKKKRDPWLTGCLIAIIIVVIIGGTIFVIDTLNQGPTTTVPTPPASENGSSTQPLPTSELALRLDVE